jgi:hypothetical protein
MVTFGYRCLFSFSVTRLNTPTPTLAWHWLLLILQVYTWWTVVFVSLLHTHGYRRTLLSGYNYSSLRYIYFKI